MLGVGMVKKAVRHPERRDEKSTLRIEPKALP
jgi:hypothetical protein